MNIPNKKGVEIAVKKIFRLLFPDNEKLTSLEIDVSGNTFTEPLAAIFDGLVPVNEKILQKFLVTLPSTKEILLKDAEFILESDPAAKQLIEVIAIYPGFYAIYCYRIAHSIDQLSVPLLPRMITEYAHKITGIDIHPGAIIGSPFSIDHGTGIVIGETASNW